MKQFGTIKAVGKQVQLVGLHETAVSKKTGLVVVGPGAGSKLAQAAELGTFKSGPPPDRARGIWPGTT